MKQNINSRMHVPTMPMFLCVCGTNYAYLGKEKNIYKSHCEKWHCNYWINIIHHQRSLWPVHLKYNQYETCIFVFILVWTKIPLPYRYQMVIIPFECGSTEPHTTSRYVDVGGATGL